MNPGERVIWRKEQRGGYGFITRAFSRVVRCGFKRVLVEVADRRGGSRLRWVSPGRLDVPTVADLAEWPADLLPTTSATVARKRPIPPDSRTNNND